MIIGAVSSKAQEATVVITVRGPTGAERTVDAVVDTGFSGALALPSFLVDEISLSLATVQRAVLADGSNVEARLYRADVVWDGRPREVRVVATGGTTLVGMALLRGPELCLQVTPGGRVTIVPLES